MRVRLAVRLDEQLRLAARTAGWIGLYHRLGLSAGQARPCYDAMLTDAGVGGAREETGHEGCPEYFGLGGRGAGAPVVVVVLDAVQWYSDD